MPDSVKISPNVCRIEPAAKTPNTAGAASRARIR